MPDACSDHAAVAVGLAMYVLGGCIDGRGTIASVLKFDTAQGTWSQVAPMPEVSCDVAACVIGGDIFIFGGWRHDLGDDQASVFKYDTVADEWSTLTPMPSACSSHRASVLDGLVYIVGAGESCREVLRFDPVLGVWSTLAPTLRRRDEGSLFALGGSLYAVGNVMCSATAERYDVAGNTWSAVADLLQGRSYLCAVTIGSAGPAEEQDFFDSLITKALRRRP
jgi:hypothetical protein